jgi:hypothetical protein
VYAGFDVKRTIITVSVIILFFMNVTGIYAGSDISYISVTTEVLPVVKYEIIHQEKSLLITEEDIKKGYIDVHGAVVFSVLSNSRNGYVLTFFVARNLFKGVKVSYDSVSSVLHDANNEVHIAFERMKYVRKELSFRFYLSDILRPGTYDWPVAFMINGI